MSSVVTHLLQRSNDRTNHDQVLVRTPTNDLSPSIDEVEGILPWNASPARQCCSQPIAIPVSAMIRSHLLSLSTVPTTAATPGVKFTAHRSRKEHIDILLIRCQKYRGRPNIANRLRKMTKSSHCINPCKQISVPCYSALILVNS